MQCAQYAAHWHTQYGNCEQLTTKYLEEQDAHHMLCKRKNEQEIMVEEAIKYPNEDHLLRSDYERMLCRPKALSSTSASASTSLLPKFLFSEVSSSGFNRLKDEALVNASILEEIRLALTQREELVLQMLNMAAPTTAACSEAAVDNLPYFSGEGDGITTFDACATNLEMKFQEKAACGFYKNQVGYLDFFTGDSLWNPSQQSLSWLRQTILLGVNKNPECEDSSES